LEAKALGADLILLIAACLTPAEVRSLAAFAGSLGLEALLELHAEEELGHVCDEVALVGINNRDLRTFAVDVERSLRMAARLPSDRILVAESGIDSPGQVRLFRDHGFRGFLVGERFMREEDPAEAFRTFMAGNGENGEICA
ncbi:MAG: indole-3-glycerol-phosphate synthase TrpC, partial [Chitinophagia bacterium]|nr:indole-3-glycerol-phosphate synthase TrpC [Chitinophagia bacterium]